MSYKKYGELIREQQPQTDLSMYVVEVKDEAHKTKLLANNQLVVLDIYADWCGPCKIIAPKYAELARKYGSAGRLVLCKEHADLNLSNVRGLPTFLFYRQGQLIDHLTVLGADIKKVESNIVHLLQSVGLYPEIPEQPVSDSNHYGNQRIPVRPTSNISYNTHN